MGNGALVVFFEFGVHLYFPDEDSSPWFCLVHCFPKCGPGTECKPTTWERERLFKKI